jgi:hypothetical protein
VAESSADRDPLDRLAEVAAALRNAPGNEESESDSVPNVRLWRLKSSRNFEVDHH